MTLVSRDEATNDTRLALGTDSMEFSRQCHPQDGMRYATPSAADRHCSRPLWVQVCTTNKHTRLLLLPHKLLLLQPAGRVGAMSFVLITLLALLLLLPVISSNTLALGASCTTRLHSQTMTTMGPCRPGQWQHISMRCKACDDPEYLAQHHST